MKLDLYDNNILKAAWKARGQVSGFASNRRREYRYFEGE